MVMTIFVSAIMAPDSEVTTALLDVAVEYSPVA